MPTQTVSSVKTILITGTSTGIGRATALACDRAGYRVLAGVRRAEDAVLIHAEAGPLLKTLILDVTRKQDIENAVSMARDISEGQGLTALINNAGFNYNTAYEYTEGNKARALMEVNFFGVHELSLAMIPLLRQAAATGKQTSKLINIGSIGSVVGIPWEAFYHASKFALLGLSESIAHEVFAQNIRVCVVMPGGIKTAFIEKSKAGSAAALSATPPEGLQRYGRGLNKLSELTGMVDRFGSSPEKVANCILKLIPQRNPAFKTTVGVDAKLMNGMRSILPTAVFHGFIRKQFGC